MSVIQHRPSQTLLEAVLAIGVILVAVIGSTTLIVTTITAGQSSEDKIVAGNLAREGIEVVRGMRDSNWLKRSMNETCGAGATVYDWDTLPDCTSFGPVVGNIEHYYPALSSSTPYNWTLNKCTVSSGNANTFSTCDDALTRVSRYLNGNISFTTNACSPSASCTDTKYARQIEITKLIDSTAIGDIDSLNVTSTVKWENHGAKTLTLTERLYDWR